MDDGPQTATAFLANRRRLRRGRTQSQTLTSFEQKVSELQMKTGYPIFSLCNSPAAGLLSKLIPSRDGCEILPYHSPYFFDTVPPC
jgi:hypothetical protein